MRAFHRSLLRHRVTVMVSIVIWMIFFIVGITYYRMHRMAHVSPLIGDRQWQAHHHEEDGKPSLIDLQCNAPHLIEAKSEVLPQSLMSDHRLSLESVVMVIRHGDRGPLRAVRNFHDIIFDPLELDEEKKQHLLKEEGLADLFHLFKRTKKPKASHKNSLSFDLVPSSKGMLGQLSVMGSLQHLKLGLEMGRVYGKHLNPESRLEPLTRSIRAVTTSFERTFQSAASFLFGFMNHSKSSPEDVMRVIVDKIEGSHGNFLCNNREYCANCNKANSLKTAWESLRDQEVAAHPALVELLAKVANFLAPGKDEHDVLSGASRDAVRSFKGLEKPNQAIDGLNAFLCHGAELPCQGSACVTTEDATRLIAFMNKLLHKTSSNEVFQLMNILNVRGCFQRLIDQFNDISNGKEMKAFTLLSAHDITLVPIAATLGFWDATVPPYASRIAFEVYKQQNSDETVNHYFRIVYNGKDVTKNTGICRETTECTVFEAVTPLEINDMERSSKTHSSHPTTFILIPIKMLESFITKKFIQLANTDNFEEACFLQ